MSGHSSKVSDFMAGLVIGAVAGSVIALLSAPKSGEETRDLISDKSRELRHKAMDTVDMAKDKTEKVIAEGRDKVEHAVSKVKDRTEDAIGQGQEMSDKIRRAANQVDLNS